VPASEHQAGCPQSPLFPPPPLLTLILRHKPKPYTSCRDRVQEYGVRDAACPISTG
jgi:hypothetical protein